MTFAVNASTQVAATGSTAPASTKQPGQLGQEEFLQLLIAQLRYQDPTSPMDTNGLMSQTASLTTVERLTEMSGLSRQGFDLQVGLAATSLVGRQVTFATGDGSPATGTVDSVDLSGAVPVLSVGEHRLAMDQISSVSTPQA